MAKEYAKKFYKSAAWLHCRAGYIESVFGLCERCGKPGKILHHKTYLTPENMNDPYITLGWQNLEYLCQDCHNNEHMEIQSEVRSDVQFDQDGRLIPKEKL